MEHFETALFEKNLEYLKTYLPSLYERLKKIELSKTENSPETRLENETESEPEYEKVDGCYQAVRENIRCFVSSRYNVPREMESMFSSVPKDTKQIMIFGFAFGDSVKYALNSQNFLELESLIIVEPSLKWFKIALTQVDLEKILIEDGIKITLLIGYSPAQAARIIAVEDLFYKKDYTLVGHLPVRNLFERYYRQLIDEIVEKIRLFHQNVITGSGIFYLTAYNKMRNLIIPSYNFKDIMELFKGRKIIIVGAGPSLEKNMHLLPEAKKKAIVIAAATANSILNERGIVPHFRIGEDTRPNQMKKILGKSNDEQIPLLYANQLYAGVLLSYKGASVRMTMNSDILSRFIYNRKGIKTIALTHGSSTVDFAAAAMCQSHCAKLVFVGQDMCSYDYKQYAGSPENEWFFKGLQEKKIKDNKNFVYVKDIYGNDVISLMAYYDIKRTLERFERTFGRIIEFINATEGGLGIEGVPNRPLAELLDEWEEDDPQQAINEYLEKAELMDFKDELFLCKEALLDIDHLNCKIMEILYGIRNILDNGEQLDRDKCIEAFNEVQKITQELKKIDWYSEWLEIEIISILEPIYKHWESGLDSSDELVKFRAILEIQLQTAQIVKLLTMLLDITFQEIYA